MNTELAEAFRRTQELGNQNIDRLNWTHEQWSDDAERIMNHIDGCASALKNGHIIGLLATIKSLREMPKLRTITTMKELRELGDGALVSEHYSDFERVGGKWMSFGNLRRTRPKLPATVLREPTK